jgi:hypothetical protein
MEAFLRIISHLLPNARAWRIVVNKQLREWFEGLAEALSVHKTYFDEIWLDIFPESTRELGTWEAQFGLLDTGLTEQERRDRLDATWKAVGGQSPRYIQDTLQAAGFDVYVYEWWEPIGGRPNGGSIDGDVTPVARDPRDYLDDGTGSLPFLMYDGGADAQDGDAVSQDGGTSTPAGYPLVNKINESPTVVIGDGDAAMNDGAITAQDGGGVITFNLVQYVVPSDPTKWPYFLYIGGATFPDQANVPEARRDEFENLCLKICPTEQWLGILVSYS